MKRFLFLVLVTVSLSAFCLASCGEKNETKNYTLLKDYFGSEILVTEKYESFSFIMAGGEITFISPEILKNAKIFSAEDKLLLQTSEYEIMLPEGFSKSIGSICKLFQTIKSGNFSDFKFENENIIFGDCQIKPEDDYIIFKTNDKEYTIQKRTKENEKDTSRS